MLGLVLLILSHFFINISFKLNDLVSLRPNYLFFIGYLNMGGGEGFSGSATEKEQRSTTMDSDIKVSHVGIAIRLINSFAEQLFRFSPFFFVCCANSFVHHLLLWG